MARVLVIDDEPLVASAMARVLRSHGAEVVVELDPTRAMAAIEASPPEIIMADLHMPGLRGTALLAQVKARFPDIRRALVTAFAADISQAEWLEIQPCALVAKPFTTQELVRLVEPSAP